MPLKKKTALVLLLLMSSSAVRAQEPETQPKTNEQEYLERSESASHWFFEKLPRHLGEDILETFLSPVALVWTNGILLSGIVGTQDSAIQESMASHNLLGRGNGFFNVFGEIYTLGGISFATVLAGFFLKNEKLKLLGEIFVESLFLTEAMTLGFKYGVGRARPDGSDNYSFPSGHASASFAMATSVTAVYGPWAGIPSYALASLIALSRLDDNKHFVSDVLFGATIGTAFALGTARFHKKENHSLFVVPQMNLDSMGISLVKTF